MSQELNKLTSLKERANMLKLARHFFYERDVLEVDCPILSQSASVDAHIDLISTTEGYYLHSSPEYGMKRLLSEGMGDIFQLSHVFRKGELGHKHQPEFMMAEWYRQDFSLQKMIEETVQFIELFINKQPLLQKTYREMFLEHTDIDIVNASCKTLLNYCHKHSLSIYPGIEKEGVDALLNVILGSQIEPQLGREEIFIVTHYPVSQAALAKKSVMDGYPVAERFEIYYKGMELANGYHELADADEQKERLIEANKERLNLGKEELPIDQEFLQALENGLPDCSGVAVGFDRLMMLRLNTNTIDNVIPFSLTPNVVQ